MSEEEILLQDKWLEAVYHLKRMEKSWELIISEPSKRRDESRYFKYEFNAFVNSIRSVTFVMQKCFKNKNEKFEDWYLNVQDYLKNNEFSKLINEIRNINQKEGNIFPDIIEVRKVNDFFNIEITFSPIAPNSNKLLDGLSSLTDKLEIQIPNNITNFEIKPNPDSFNSKKRFAINPDEDLNEQLDKFEHIVISEYIKEVSSKGREISPEEFKNTSFLNYKLKILKKIYYWDDFKKECYDMIYFLRDKCQESIKELK